MPPTHPPTHPPTPHTPTQIDRQGPQVVLPRRDAQRRPRRRLGPRGTLLRAPRAARRARRRAPWRRPAPRRSPRTARRGRPSPRRPRTGASPRCRCCAALRRPWREPLGRRGRAGGRGSERGLGGGCPGAAGRSGREAWVGDPTDIGPTLHPYASLSAGTLLPTPCTLRARLRRLSPTPTPYRRNSWQPRWVVGLPSRPCVKRPAGQGKLTVPYTHLSTIPVTPLLHYCVAVARWLSRLPQRSALCLLVKSIYLVNVCTPSYSPPPISYTLMISILS